MMNMRLIMMMIMVRMTMRILMMTLRMMMMNLVEHRAGSKLADPQWESVRRRFDHSITITNQLHFQFHYITFHYITSYYITLH